MQRKQSPWISWLAPGVVAMSLIFSPAARAQDDEAATESKSRSLDGYIATSLLCGLALC